MFFMENRKIKILDKIVADQIAAGEVVSRPASVVKELVENSIDAGATKIDVDVIAGGIISLTVSDDGEGIAPDDIPLALLRHATSKLSDIGDLDKLYTLGFRGEALASISSVARVKITSQQRNIAGQSAYTLESNGGIVSDLKKAGRAPGTTIEVSDLFYNVPARRKFLKREITEFGHIADIVEKLIFSFPEIKFSLSHNGKKVYNSPGNGSLLDALSSVYPKDLVKKLVKIDYGIQKITLLGYISSPLYTVSDKSKQVFFVNRRHIYNATLSKALEEGYRNILEKDRSPVGVIFITLDPKDVDVNVHPSKREVKFADNTEIYSIIKAAVSSLLHSVVTECPSSDNYQPMVQSLGNQGVQIPRASVPGLMIERPSDSAENLFAFNKLSSPGSTVASRPAEIQHAMQALSPIETLKKGTIVQIFNTYLIEEKDGNMTMYDQHALHERILFEQLLKKDREISSQKLLVPEMVFLSKSELALLEEYLVIFKDSGFEIEFFGQDCILIRAVPTFLTNKNYLELFSQIITDILTIRKSEAIEKITESVLKIVACRSAIKAGDRLSDVMIQSLFREAAKTPNIDTCPHGRPTHVEFSQHDLEKMFHRT
ncbi:MAG TPA: DNA mismatch repair endonuclease MutL [Candidatus Margulisbacteria bacterium]|nr:DNA mismatch repair endonuclease MutL [Candidatus Margulisiibacteriota bacterium]